MLASIAGDTGPDVFATTLRSDRTSGLRVPRHKDLDSMRTYCWLVRHLDGVYALC
jgi:hypothetical protein